MASVIDEWVRKARADLATARRELAATTDPNLDAVCFHAQQGVEKLLKACLIHAGREVPRTHDLVQLARMTVAPPLQDERLLDELLFLSRAAVEYRYPGDSAEVEDAREALEIACRIAPVLEMLLNQPGSPSR